MTSPARSPLSRRRAAAALRSLRRARELLGLRRGDLDLRNARLHVRQQWTKDGANGRAVVTLKTGQKAWRTVDLDRDTVEVLEMQVAMIDAEREQWGSAYLDQVLVFPGRTACRRTRTR